MKPGTYETPVTMGPHRSVRLTRIVASRLRTLLAIVCALLWPLALSQAASYYVDFASGSDDRAGTSKDTAWKRCPGDEAAAGVAAGTSLKPGDVVYFKGGVVYLGGITISASGQQGQEIILDGNHSGSWGVGRAIIDRENVPRACVSGGKNASHLIIRGFELRNSGGYADNDPILSTTEPVITKPIGGSGVSFASANTNLRLENLYIHRIGQWRNQLPFSGTNSITGVGIWLQGCEGVLVESCELTKMRTAITITGAGSTKNITVNNCEIHDYIVWGIDVAPRSEGTILENISILNTIIRDYHQFDQGNWLGGGEKPHTDGIFIRSAGMASTWKNITVAGCTFYADDPGASKGGTASIYVSQGPSVDIYNNVFIRDRHVRCIDVTSGGSSKIPVQTVNIINNTFIDSPAVTFSNKNSVPNRFYRFVNNLVVLGPGSAANRALVTQADTPLSELDHNVYYSVDFDESQVKGWHLSPGGGYLTLQAVKNLGWEAAGRYGPANLMRFSGLPSQMDIRPTAASTAAKAGKNYSALFSKDKAGRMRPATGPWDVGAYMVVSPGTALPIGKPSGFGLSTN